MGSHVSTPSFSPPTRSSVVARISWMMHEEYNSTMRALRCGWSSNLFWGFMNLVILVFAPGKFIGSKRHNPFFHVDFIDKDYDTKKTKEVNLYNVWKRKKTFPVFSKRKPTPTMCGRSLRKVEAQ